MIDSDCLVGPAERFDHEADVLEAKEMVRPDAAATPVSVPLTAGSRGLSLAEFAIGGAIVIAHNVFHLVPNQVPILFLPAIASIRLRQGNWRAIRFSRPKSRGLPTMIPLAK